MTHLQRNLLFAGILTLALASLAATERSGGDFQIYCAGAARCDEGGNPYDVAQLRRAGSPSDLPMTSPALILPILCPACARQDYVAL